ncbi:MAG: alpha/beta hydrolase [Acidobacteriaceae bacterium]|nr:alpha/beta hydrolase [Acidobacteriaceae bacterium]
MSAYRPLTFHNGNVSLQAVSAGPEKGIPLLLLHGFPEFWYGWRRQIDALAEAGFYVVAPNQRGYNTSDKPWPVSAYTVPHLVSDVLAIADQLGGEKFCLAGHDWGAAVAWNVALQHSHRVSRLAILNVPHPSVMLHHVKTSPAQMVRSWYILFFQLPWLPERLLEAGNFRLLASSLLRTSRRGTFSPEDLRRYRQAWLQPGALRGMIHWYRAAARYQPKITDPLVRVPTRILWGVRDPALRFRMAEESLRYCQEGELVRFDDCTHWLQHEAPERVNRLMVEFFSESMNKE